MLKYSVLMAIYSGDRPDYFEMAVASMLAQTIPPEQVVVVIDGPVSEELQCKVDQYAADNALFTILQLKEN